jgi:aldehyde dehydrogenase (NAD+)/aldehyde dehydrogenase
MEDNLEYLATLETIDNGKPIRESRAADIPYCIDHFVISQVLSVQMKEASEHDKKYIKHRFTRAYWSCWRNHSLNSQLMLAWKIVQLLATGCTAVKPAEQTPTSVNVNGIDR